MAFNPDPIPLHTALAVAHPPLAMAGLLPQAAAGDATAWRDPAGFARLYRQARPRILRVVLRINQRPAEAEEIVQDVFAMAWVRQDQFDNGRGNVMAWLAAMARNRAVDSLRRHGGKPRRMVSTGSADEVDLCDRVAAAGPQPPEQLGSARAAAAVHARLGQLGQDQRTCLTLAYFDGLSQVEIAQRMGRPLGTVKSWVRRALLTMQPALLGH